MRKIMTMILDKLDAYLRDNTTESSMRLFGLLIVLVGCVCAIAFTTFIGIVVIQGKTISLVDAAAVYCGIATFTAVGIYGKVKQFKLEQDAVTTKDV